MRTGKLICGILTVILTVMVTISFAVLVFGSEPAVETKTVYKQVELSLGDTLWELAEEYKGENEKTEHMIEAIMELNNLSSSHIKAGESLLIPVEKVI